MPQIAIIQTAPQAAPAPSSHANNGGKGFSPHLDKAISSQNGSSAGRDSNSTRNTTSKDSNGAVNGKVDKMASNSEQPENMNESAAPESAPVQETDTALAGGNLLDIPLAESLQQTANSANPTPLAILMTSSTGNGKGSVTGQQGFGASVSTAMNNAPGSGLFASPEADLLLPPPAYTQELQPARDAILLQLQKIIENGDEVGKVSITLSGNNLKVITGASSMQTTLQAAVMSGEASPPVLATIAPTDITPEVAQFVGANGQEIPGEKANQNLTSVRHSIQQQYYDGKIAQKTTQEDNSSSPNNQQNNNQQNSTLGPQVPATGDPAILASGLPEQASTFAQSLAVPHEGQKLPGGEMSRPVTLPSGTVVHQDEVVRQLIERFHIARRDADTRVNIQLHPAELGELKIDLSVKAGSIRANVLASSQVTQEIIEKNLSKLRTILENQGFTIEEFSVTAKSDTVGEFNLFDRQLFSQNEYTPSSPRNTKETGQRFNLHELGLNDNSQGTGLNVTI